jgi:hypothetical protein
MLNYTNKPLQPGLVYRKQATTAQVPVATRTPSTEEKNAASDTAKRLLKLVVLDN